MNIGSGPQKERNLMEWHKKVCTKKEFPNDYSNELVEAINTLTTRNAPVKLYGTSIYKSLIYAGDVDVHQWVPVNSIASEMQEAVRRIQKSNKYLIGDIKCGLDLKYLPLYNALGHIKNGIIIGFKPSVFKMYKIKIPKEITLESWIDLFNKVHELITLRWSSEDILNGYLNLNGKTINLVDASKQTPLNKIDMYGFINGKYLEITNVFVPDKNINASIYDLQINFLVQYFSGNYAKAIKRAYAIARIIGNKNDSTYIKQLYPFLVSQTNLLSSCASDIDVLVVILSKGISLDRIKNKIISSLNVVISKMGNYYESNIEYIIEEIKHLFGIIDTENNDIFIKNLEKIEENIKKIVNDEALKYINKKRINLLKLFGP